ncbi:hypothetical protein QWY86_14680 [Pedobacter aquatilis]|uniref:hypothetical protein n=1 Tax=Pedobacter aquatilis TaxID=351343 RepID=UPI0025B48F75|nr:hypothetical protein [Pedobacter aquatilis]MDN3587924.1 hypothetical protein [Pedobacter aquatilis]
MEQEDNQTFEIKTVLIFWYNFIFFITTFLVFAGAIITFKPQGIIYFFLTIGVSVILAYLFSGIAKSNAIISIQDNQITIEQENSIIKKVIDITIDINGLRGFEIGELTTRFDTSLAFYTKDFEVYRYRLNSKVDTFKLEVFLSQHLPKLNAKSNPEYSSFIKAFGFVLKNILILFLFTAIIWGIINCFIDLSNLRYAIISFAFPILFWRFVTRNILIKNNFRFAATYWIMLIFPFTALGLIFPLKNNIEELLSEPLAVDVPINVFSHPKENFFYIKKIKGCADKIITSYSIGSETSKSQYITINHAVETQVTDLNEHFNNIWFRKRLSQKINKATPEEDRTILISDFQNKSRREFEEMLKEKATFYKVLLNRQGEASIAILEPFWKPINIYKKDIQRNIYLIIGGIIVLLLIGICMITINR